MKKPPLRPSEKRTDLAKSVRADLMKPEFLAAIKSAFPGNVTAERLARVALSSVQKNPKLMECTRFSLYASILEAAQLGLDLDGHLGHAYLVPFKDKATMMIGYKGLRKLAMNSGLVSHLYARCVYKKDHIVVRYGDSATIDHAPSLDDDRGSLVGSYAIAILRDGTKAARYLTRKEIEDRRKRSRAADAGPWVTDFDAMAEKSALRALARELPLDVQAQRAIERDEHKEMGVDVEPFLDGDFAMVEEPEPTPAPEQAPEAGYESPGRNLHVKAGPLKPQSPAKQIAEGEQETFDPELIELK